LSNSNLDDVVLSNADMAGADLSGASAVSANLNGAKLNGAVLNLTDLTRAKLNKSECRSAELQKAKLTNAVAESANLRGANLCGADLSGAKLYGSNLTEADLSQAKLERASFGRTVLNSTNLTSATGLELATHFWPSFIDYRTLSLSGQLATPFLRGCGLPDQFIDYLPSLLNQAVQFYSCFISYSTKDQDFADRLYADLQNKGVRCWFAPHHIQGGKKVHEQIDEAIRVYDRLLLILSENSMSSEWVKTEIANARQREIREKRQMLFPISLAQFENVHHWKAFDADTGKDSAREIREYFIPDFSNWKDHDSYLKAFDRLLRDLKTDEAKAQKA
jgi:uncharacterized protein YjbI with pentapeptide repeats